jgi:transcriptional repressor NrdR
VKAYVILASVPGGRPVKCPFCGKDNDRVVDSRSASDGELIRRRRECLLCGRRYTTHEEVEQTRLRVIKKDGSRVPFDREKVLAGMLKACEKRPVATADLDAVVTDIERDIHQQFEREVPASFIGEAVMKRLKELDTVAYVRFASVYREFQDVRDFQNEVERIRASASAEAGPTKGPAATREGQA